MAEYTVIRDVELISVGMKWHGVNGDMTFTFEHLADACEAANADPHVVSPRNKIGHEDPRFNSEADLAAAHDPFYDGEPTIGVYRNLHLVNDGATLLGDLVECPEWLAEAAPSAYPSRSSEGSYTAGKGLAGEPVGTWAVTTPGGKHYSFVLTAVAMLGMSRPAVSDLEDLRRWLTEGDGLIVAGSEPPEGGVPADARIEGVPTAAAAPATARADADKVIDVFLTDVATEADGRYWWWPRALWTDPNEVIADDDEGGLWRVPFTSNGDQDVTFSEPVRVLQTFVDAPASAAAVAAEAIGIARHERQRPTLAFAARAETPASERKKSADEGGVTGGAQLRGMNFSDEQRPKLAVKLGLAEDATEDQILAAVLAEGEPEGGDGGSGDGGDGGGEGEGAPAGGDGGEGSEGDGSEGDGEGSGEGAGGEGGAAAAASPTTPVDNNVLNRLKTSEAKLASMEAKEAERHREALLTAAVKDGRIMPASRAAWNDKLVAAPDATEAELEALPKDLIPLEQRGTAAAAASAQVTDNDMELLFPGHATRKAA